MVNSYKERRVSIDFKNEGIFLCPKCNGEYLHQSDYSIFNRKDLSETGTHLEVCKSGRITLDDNCGMASKNPSTRKDGILISFRCESCDFPNFTNSIFLAIQQCEGHTLMHWIIDETK